MRWFALCTGSAAGADVEEDLLCLGGAMGVAEGLFAPPDPAAAATTAEFLLLWREASIVFRGVVCLSLVCVVQLSVW